MNDAWDPIEDLEPLDRDSLGLLASYRDAAGPSEDAEARMLAGLRARLGQESDAEDPATAVPPNSAASPLEHQTPSNARTLAIAAIAFAAGVALTVSLRPSPAPQGPVATSNRGRDPIAQRDAARLPGPVSPEAAPHRAGSTSAPDSVASGVAPSVERSWPLSFADLTTPQTVQPDLREVEEVEPMPGRPSLNVEPSAAEQPGEETSPAPRRHADDGPTEASGSDGTAAPDPLRSGSADPSAAGSGSASRSAWAPSVSGTPSGASVGSAARNPAVAGASPSAPNPGQSSSNTGGEGPSEPPAGEPPASDEPRPSDEPDPDPDPSDEDEQDEEPELEEVCAGHLDDCLADAQLYCEYGYEGCPFVTEFCYTRAATCLGEDGAFPEPYEPEPEPIECDVEYDLCLMDTEAMCTLDKLPPQECEDMYWMCEDILASCHGEPPPDPPW